MFPAFKSVPTQNPFEVTGQTPGESSVAEEVLTLLDEPYGSRHWRTWQRLYANERGKSAAGTGSCSAVREHLQLPHRNEPELWYWFGTPAYCDISSLVSFQFVEQQKNITPRKWEFFSRYEMLVWGQLIDWTGRQVFCRFLLDFSSLFDFSPSVGSILSERDLRGFLGGLNSLDSQVV